MDWEQFMAMLSGRPAQQPHSITQIGQAYDMEQARQQREQGRQEYMQRVNAPPPPPTDDLFAILQRNLANPDSQNPQLQALRAAGQEHVGQAQDIAANAQSDVAALEMQPPLRGQGPALDPQGLMAAFAPEQASAAPAEADKSIKFLGLPEPTPRPMPQPRQPFQMPPQAGKPTAPVFAQSPAIIGPGGVTDPSFIPPEALPPRAQTPVLNQAVDPRRPVIGPGGANGQPVPFGPGLDTGLQLGSPQALAPAQQEPFRIDWPMGQGPRPAPAPQAAQPTTAPGPDMSTLLNQQELARFMQASAAPAPSQPPPAPEVPAMSAPRAAPVPQPVPLPAGATPPTNTPPAPMPNEQIPPHLKDQLLQEAIRITRSQRQPGLGAR